LTVSATEMPDSRTELARRGQACPR
jgi:hypothetical protein